MKKLTILFLLSCFAFSLSAFSADNDGKFAVKGAGKRSCSNFISTAENKTTDYYLYGGWLEGFLSSYNQFQPKNFDITPWQTTELMLTLLQNHCKANPEIKFLSAVNSLIKTLFPIRLNSNNNLVKIQVGSFEGYYYQEIILRAKQRLKKLGHLNTDIKNKFSKADAIAFESYQKSIGLQITGIPDQKTLLSLFLKKI
jgi:hypothetical protein